MGDIADKIGEGKRSEKRVSALVETRSIWSQIDRLGESYVINGKPYGIAFLRDGKVAVYTNRLKEFNIFGGCHDEIDFIFDVCGGVARVEDKEKGWAFFTIDSKLVFGGYHLYAGEAIKSYGGVAEVGETNRKLTFYISFDGLHEFYHREISFENATQNYSYFNHLGIGENYLKALRSIGTLSEQAADGTLFSSFDCMIKNIMKRYAQDKANLKKQFIHSFRVIEKEFSRNIGKYLECKGEVNG